MSKQKKAATKGARKSALKRAHGAHVAKGAAEARQGTTVAPERPTTHQGAPHGQEGKKSRKAGLLAAAILVLGEAGKPMSAKEMTEAVLAKGEWTTRGKTPAATLYASILREIQKKGQDARFRKVDRGQFALNA